MNRINGSIMLITHDLGVITEMADEVVVMYAGRIIEKGSVRRFSQPQTPLYNRSYEINPEKLPKENDTV